MVLGLASDLFKVQYRSGLFLMPALTLLYVFVKSMYHFDILFVVLAFVYGIFFVQIHSHVSVKLLSISGVPVSKFTVAYNLTILSWFNSWYIIGSFFYTLPLDNFIVFNSAVLGCLLAGNAIGNSITVEVRSAGLRNALGLTSFSLIVGLVEYLAKLASFFNLLWLFFALMFFVYFADISRYGNMNFKYDTDH